MASAAARHAGEPPEAIQSCLDGIAGGYQATARADGLGSLTLREREIAWLVTEGMTNGQIARRLGVTAKTVEKHLGSTMAKLGGNARLHDYAFALKEFAAKENAPFADQFHALVDVWGKNKPKEALATFESGAWAER